MHEEFIKRSGEIKNIKYLFKITRPKQWLKNLLILIPPIISGSIIKWTLNDVKQTILVLIIFTLASVNVYVLNDIIDAPIDRLSQNRKNRPIAAGEISLNVAKIFLLFLMILLFVFLINMSFKIKCIILGYILLNIFYSILLKKIAYWEMFSVSIGFLLRAIAGTGLVDKVPSQEFYAIVFFGSLLVISGKRLSEFNNPPESHRSILKNYKLKNIEGIINLSLVLMTGAYCLFISSTFFSNVSLISNFFVYFSLLPFLAIIFNIHSIAISGKLENPESQLFTNKNLIFNILIWISVFLLGTRNW